MLDTKALGSASIYKLLPQFAIPAILSGLVSAVYNIVDQIFIGRVVGLLGNAATNIAFPVVLLCTAVSIMAGVGCSAGFNMASGKGRQEEAGCFVGQCLDLLLFMGLGIGAVTLVFLQPLLILFGSTEAVLPYAHSYLGLVAWGIPFSVLGVGGSIIIRSDGSPGYALGAVLAGAVLNVVLDAWFMLGLDLGIAGAAGATVIGQALTLVLVLRYFRHFKTLPLVRVYFWPVRRTYLHRIAALGMGPLINHASMSVVQLLLNNTLKYYGVLSLYGSDIPLAAVGVITKLNTIFTAVIIGIAQGVQPIISFNYGAGQYDRVREAARKALAVMLAFSWCFFGCCQLLPRQLVSIFGSGPEEYFIFAERYLRIFMLLVCVNGLQITAGNIFTSIGKASLSVFISLTRQLFFLPPLLLFLPLYFGLDGALYAGPAADAMCVAVAVYLLGREDKKLRQLQEKKF